MRFKTTFFFPLLITLIAQVVSPIYGQLGNMTPFTWVQGTYRLNQSITINQVTITGPTALDAWYDITVVGLNWYDEPAGTDFNGAGQWGFVLTSGFVGQLPGPGPMGQQPGQATIGPIRWGIPNMGELHNVPPRPGYSAILNFYDAPPTDPTANLIGSASTQPAFIDVENNLQVQSLDFSAGTYVAGDLLTASVTYRNGEPLTGFGEPGRMSRPVHPLELLNIDFRLTTDPNWDQYGAIFDDFELKRIAVFGDGLNGQSFRDAFMDPLETTTITTDMLVPRNYAGTYFLGVQIDSMDSPDIEDLVFVDNWSVNDATAHIRIVDNNSPTLHPISEVSDTNGNQVAFADDHSESPSVSGDGSRIVFRSIASNLIDNNPANDTNGLYDIFLRQRDTGDIQLVSVNSKGEQANRNSQDPFISADGRYVAFSSFATNLVDGDVGGYADIFVHDVETGETVRVSRRIFNQGDIDYILEADGSSFYPTLSADGRFVVFTSFARNLDDRYIGLFPPGSAQIQHIYLHDRCFDNDFNNIDNPGNTRTYLLSVASDGQTIALDNSNTPRISLDGQWLVFSSYSKNLNPGITEDGVFEANPTLTPNDFEQVYRRRLFEGFTSEGTYDDWNPLDSSGNNPHNLAHTLELLSLNTNGDIGNSDSYQPAVNQDGTEIAFTSEATNLDLRMADENEVPDVFVRSYQDQGLGKTFRISISSGGNEAIDIEEGVSSAAGSIEPSIDSTGRFVAFRSNSDSITQLAPLVNGSSDIFLHDRDSDGNGRYDEVENSGTTTEVVSVNRFGHPARGLIGATDTNGTTFISNSYFGVPTPWAALFSSSSSRNPSISGDGRFVTFETDSDDVGGLRFGRTNLFPLDTNGVRDIFMFDRNVVTQSGNFGSGTDDPDLPDLFPPFVQILTPVNGSQFTIGSKFFLTAFATDTRSTTADNPGVVKVEFIINGEVVAVDESSPYSTTFTPKDADIYSIRARATDTDGFVTFSDPVQIEAVVSSARLPEIELIYPRDGQEFLTAQDVPLIAEIPGTPNIPGATFQFLAFFVDGEEVFNTTTQANTFQHLHQFVSIGEHKLNAVIAYLAPGPNNTQVSAQAISNTVTVEVLSSTGSQLPVVNILYPPPTPAGQAPIAITSASTVRLLANASDPDGDLECVQFYVNGIPVGDKVFRSTSQAPADFPFSVEWKPDSPGKYVVTAVAQDSGGNQTTSFPVTITSTSGINPPTTFLTDPFTPPQASVEIGPQGEITDIHLLPLEKGGAFEAVPVVRVSGVKDTAKAEATIDGSGGISNVDVIYGGSGYTRTPWVTIAGDGFGASARAVRADLDGDGFRDEIGSILITKPGTGYTVAKVVISGGHKDATAIAAIDTDGSLLESSVQVVEEGSGYLNGAITEISVLNHGSGYHLESPPAVFLDEPLSTDSDARQAVAVSELTFDGRIKRIKILDGGSGYNTPLRLEDTECEMQSNGSVLTSQDPAFLSDFVDPYFVNYGPTVNILQGADIGYPTIRIGGSTLNNGVYTVLSVDRTGGVPELILFPDLQDETVTVELWADPAPPQIFIQAPPETDGVQATATASVSSPTVQFSQVLKIIPNLPDVPILDAQGVVIGFQPPSPLVGVPLSATAYDSGPDGIPGNADDGIITNIDFYINGTVLPDDVLQATSDGGMNVFAIWKPSQLGVHEIMAISVDDDGNSTTSRPVEVYVDYEEQEAETFSPKVWITGPHDGEVFNIKQDITPQTPGTGHGQTVVTIEPIFIEVRAEPGDTHGKAIITQVQLYGNSSSLGTSNTFPYQFQYQPTSLGRVEFVAEATDIFGNVSYSEIHTVTVSDGIYPLLDGDSFVGKGPIVRITEPANGQEYIVSGSQGDPINIFADALPNPDFPTHLISQVEFFVNGDFIFADNVYPYSTQFFPPGKGEYHIRVVARDSRGIRSEDSFSANTTRNDDEAGINNITITVIEDPVLTPSSGLTPGDPTSTNPDGTYTEDQDEDFVILIHRDFYLRNPTTSERANMVNQLQSKVKTRAQLIHDMLKFEENTRNLESSMVQYMMTGSWPTRQELMFNAFLYGQGAVNPITGDPMPLVTAGGNAVERINFSAVPNPETNQGNNNNNGGNFGGNQGNRGGFGGGFGQQQQFQVTDYQYTSPNIQFPNVREAAIGGIDRGDEDTSFQLSNANPTPANPPQTGTILVGPWTGLRAIGMYYFFRNHTFSRHAYDIDENDDVGTKLFLRKYGVTPSAPQQFQLERFMDKPFEDRQGYFQKPEGIDATTLKAIEYNNESLADDIRITFILDFARDNEIETFGGVPITKIQELLYPPNNTLEDNALAHSLWVGLARQQPDEQEFLELREQGSLLNQIEYVLESPEYASRFASSTSSSATKNSLASNWAYGARTLAADWFKHEGFGYFSSPQITEGWVMHHGKNASTAGLGWIYTPFTQKPDSVWFYHEDLGWCWTSIAEGDLLFPYLYCNDKSSWLYFNDTVPGDPWLYDYTAETWTQLK